jgi:hypothetical protein
MKKFVLILGCSLFLACGPSASEIAEREKQKNDSITKVAQDELLRKQAEAEEQKRFRENLIDLEAQLAGAEAKLQSIQGFKILRTENEKAGEVEAQTKVILELRANIEEVKAQLR